MRPCRGHFHRALGLVLPLNVFEIDRIAAALRKQLLSVDDQRNPRLSILKSQSEWSPSGAEHCVLHFRRGALQGADDLWSKLRSIQ
jgi:hypothetical protein